MSEKLPVTVVHNDMNTWMDAIWTALHSYREEQIPEGDESYDREWDEIATAMAWLTEEIKEPSTLASLVIVNMPFNKTFPALNFSSESKANEFMAQHKDTALIYTDKKETFCVAPTGNIKTIDVKIEYVEETCTFDDGIAVARNMGIETYSVMAASTGHLNKSDKLAFLVKSTEEFSMVFERTTGYILKLHTNEDDAEYDISDQYSDTLNQIITFAVEHGFTAIEFDSDAPVLNGFAIAEEE